MQTQNQNLENSQRKRIKDEWVYLNCRILKEHWDQLLPLCQILVDKGLIEKAIKYDISQFAVMQLLKTLKKQQQPKDPNNVP